MSTTSPIDQQTADLIYDVIQQYVAQDVIFTAYEITLEVRSRLLAGGIDFDKSKHRHIHMRESIHDEMVPHIGSATYEETTLNITGPDNPGPERLYHPTGADTSTWKQRDRNDMVCRTSSPSTTAPAGTPG